jgi:hypothetical protein
MPDSKSSTRIIELLVVFMAPTFAPGHPLLRWVGGRASRKDGMQMLVPNHEAFSTLSVRHSFLYSGVQASFISFVVPVAMVDNFDGRAD